MACIFGLVSVTNSGIQFIPKAYLETALIIYYSKFALEQFDQETKIDYTIF